VNDQSDSLGLLEIRGFTAAMAAADAMSKAAPVRIGTTDRIGDGLVTIVSKGQIAAVQEAVAAGAAAANAIGRVVARGVIGRPSPELWIVFAFGPLGEPELGRAAIEDR